MTEIAIIQEHMLKTGFTGLYVPGECACELNDLAPCGEDPGECSYGYKHTREDDKSFWCVTDNPEPPTKSQWEEMKELGA